MSGVRTRRLGLRDPGRRSHRQWCFDHSVRPPRYGRALALSSGLAYIAASDGGLQVVNFLAFDQGQNPPEVVLGAIPGDLDPERAGIQMLETSTVTLPARISDDVQVKSVELLVDGVRVRNEVSYPYMISRRRCKRHETGREVVLQVRATDTGGNVRLQSRS